MHTYSSLKFLHLHTHYYRLHIPAQYNPNPARVLGVFGLSLYTAEKDLRELFSKYGPVDDVQVVYDHQVTQMARGRH